MIEKDTEYFYSVIQYHGNVGHAGNVMCNFERRPKRKQGFTLTIRYLTYYPIELILLQ